MRWRGICALSLLVAGCQSAPVSQAPSLAERPLPLPPVPEASALVEAAAPPTAGELLHVPTSAPAPMPALRQELPSTVRLVAAQEPADENEVPAEPAERQPASAPAELPRQQGVPEAIPARPVGLSLAEAIDIGLSRNPDLVSLRQSMPAAAAALGVARVYPYNPNVQVEVVPSPREANGDSGSTFTQVAIRQQLELRHQRRYRIRTGIAQLDRTRANVLLAEQQTVAETERRFFTALYQREVRDLNAALGHVNDQLLGVLDRRFEAGQASAADTALARIEAETARQQAAVAEAAYRTAVQSLRAQLGLISNEPLEIGEAFSALRWTAPTGCVATVNGQAPAMTEDDFAVLAAGRPDVRAAQADLQGAQAQYELAVAQKTPDLMIGPFYERDDSATTFWGIIAQTAVPVINTGQPLVNQRRAELSQRRMAFDQLHVRARLEIEAAMTRYEAARKVVERFGPNFAAQLTHDTQAIEHLYEAGQVDLLRVYSARTRTLQVQRNYLDALNELGQAAANLTAVGGLPPWSMLKPVAEPAPPRPAL